MLVLLGLPGGLALVLFHYVPLLGNVIAFQDYQPYLGLTESDWVGWQNFSFLWDGNPEFRNALWNTIVSPSLVQLVPRSSPGELVSWVTPVPLAFMT